MDWLLAGGTLAVVGVVLAAVLFFVVLFVGVFRLDGRLTAGVAERIAREGAVQLRTGRQMVSVRLKDFRAPGMDFGYKISKKYGEALLTERGLVVVLGLIVLRFADADLVAAEVALDGDRLRFKTSKPTDATGEVDLAFKTPDSAAWKRALVERGAREA